MFMRRGYTRSVSTSVLLYTHAAQMENGSNFSHPNLEIASRIQIPNCIMQLNLGRGEDDESNNQSLDVNEEAK